MRRESRPVAALLILVAVAALVTTAAAAVRWNTGPTRALCAEFDTAYGLYPDAAVTVRGVSVGRVLAVVPEGDHVRVDMSIGERPLAAGTGAVVVNASLLTDRRVELVDSETRGANELPDQGCLPRQRTRVPVSVSDALGSFSRIAEELTTPGPDGSAPLRALIDGADRELGGLGPALDQQMRAITHLLASPDAFAADLGALLDNSAELSRFVTTEWDDIKTSMFTFGPGLELLERTLVIVKILVGKLATALGPLDRAFNHHFPYLMDLLEQSVPLVVMARTRVEDSRELLATVPGVIAMLRTMIGEGGLAVEYRPPAQCPAPDPGLCASLGTNSARMPVPLAVLATVGGRP